MHMCAVALLCRGGYKARIRLLRADHRIRGSKVVHVDPRVGSELGAPNDGLGLVPGEALLQLWLGIEGVGPPDRRALLRGDHQGFPVLPLEQWELGAAALLDI